MIENRLSVLMGIKRISIGELAKLTKLTPKTVRTIYYDKSKGIDFSTLNQLCWALDCTIQDLFRYIPDKN